MRRTVYRSIDPVLASNDFYYWYWQEPRGGRRYRNANFAKCYSFTVELFLLSIEQRQVLSKGFLYSCQCLSRSLTYLTFLFSSAPVLVFPARDASRDRNIHRPLLFLYPPSFIPGTATSLCSVSCSILYLITDEKDKLILRFIFFIFQLKPLGAK